MAWGKLETTTLSGSADNISINAFLAKTFVQILSHTISTAGVDNNLTFNSDSTGTYAWRISDDGGADSTSTSQSFINCGWGTSNETMLVMCYVVNISAQEKLVIRFNMSSNTTGAGTAPDRREGVAKWTNTAAQITTINSNNASGGDYLIGSNLTAIGTD